MTHSRHNMNLPQTRSARSLPATELADEDEFDAILIFRRSWTATRGKGSFLCAPSGRLMISLNLIEGDD